MDWKLVKSFEYNFHIYFFISVNVFGFYAASFQVVLSDLKTT